MPMALEPSLTPLAGRYAVVTGATRGIGWATTRALVSAGAHVAMVARTQSALDARVAELGAERVTGWLCDLSVRSQSEELAVALAGGVNPPDILINNAGLFQLARVEDTLVQDVADSMQANLLSPFNFIRAVLPGMRARGSGHVITIGSVADRMAFPENGAYAAAKTGLRALHEVVRAETQGSGVRASLISPGPVDTELWDPIDPDSRPGFPPRAAMLRPDAVAEAVLFVATRDPSVNIDELRLSHA
jgi:NADP-dependent 3-hydroxy acid dehydrogenase YdfG